MNARLHPALERTAYQETLSGLLRLHQYTVEKQDETDEYHELCAALESYSHHLTPAENERTGGLSEDLYTVSDPPPAELEPMTLQTHKLQGEVYEAREREDWDLALKLLRKLDKVVPPPLVAYLRGTIWEGLGEKQVAVVFYERAHQLARDNGPFLAAFLSTLKWTDLERALKVASPILEASEKYNGNVVVQAVEVFYWHLTQDRPEHEVVPTLHRLIAVLKLLLERAGKEPPEVRGSYPHMTLFLLATFHRILGATREAYDSYSQLIVLEPRNDALFVSRGILAYESNPSAVADFERAIELNSQLVWPYYYMAHYLVSHRRYEECWRMCQKGLDRPAPRRVHSALLEFLAISMGGLGFPPEMVRRAFEDARRVDPENERAGENLRRYLVALSASKARVVEWDYPTSPTIRNWNPLEVLGSHLRGHFSFVGTAEE